jgi:SAM-dependent methyltransferase
MDAAHLQPGEVILGVGGGTGVLDRWMARRTAGANRLVAVDVNRFLLQEATTLARQEGVEHRIECRAGSADAVPFPANHCDVTMSSPMMQRVDADRRRTAMTRVTRPGRRVAVVGHAHDRPPRVHLPLPPARQAHIAASGGHDADTDPLGGDASSRERRLPQAGSAQGQLCPQCAAFDEAARLHQMQASLLPTLDPAATQAW